MPGYGVAILVLISTINGILTMPVFIPLGIYGFWKFSRWRKRGKKK